MDDYNYEKLKEAGKVSTEALAYSRSVIKPGMKMLDAAESIEKLVRGKGYGFAFPINLSINENAAHYSPDIDDSTVFSERDVIKVDLGARKDAYLTDCAITIDLTGQNTKLVEAVDKALEEAISMVKAGRKVSEIGSRIEETAKKYGFKPIRNLGGHGIDKVELHSSVFIPNYDNGDDTELEEGQVVAIEPFMTTGKGLVEDGPSIQIYQKISDALPRSAEARAIMGFVGDNYLTYPFSRRWLQHDLKSMSEFSIRKGISELLQLGALEQFPVLVEKGKGMVSQAEKELIVEKDSCTIVTK